jgi:hypothetical protein
MDIRAALAEGFAAVEGFCCGVRRCNNNNNITTTTHLLEPPPHASERIQQQQQQQWPQENSTTPTTRPCHRRPHCVHLPSFPAFLAEALKDGGK